MLVFFSKDRRSNRNRPTGRERDKFLHQGNCKRVKHRSWNHPTGKAGIPGCRTRANTTRTINVRQRGRNWITAERGKNGGEIPVIKHSWCVYILRTKTLGLWFPAARDFQSVEKED